MLMMGMGMMMRGMRVMAMVPPFWAAKLGFLARMPGLAGLTKRS